MVAVISGLARPVSAQWSAPVQVSSAPKIFTFVQSYDFDANGHIHMVYRNWDSGQARIYYATNMSGAWVQTSLLDGDNNFLVITPDQVLHFFYLAPDDQIFERTKPVSGESWSASEKVALSPEKGFINDVIVDSAGGIYFSWGHLFDSALANPSASYGRYKPLGGVWGPTEFIRGVNNDIWPQNLNLAVRGTDILAAYRLTNTTAGARLMIRSGGTWGAEVVVAPGKAYSGTIAVSPTGELAMVYWHSSDTPLSGTHWEIWASFSTDGGATWSPRELIEGNPDLHRNAFTTYDQKGNLHVGWEGRLSESGKFKTFYRARIGGLWQPREIVADNGNSNMHGLKISGRTLYCTYNTAIGVADSTNQVFLKTKALSTDDTPPPAVSDLTITQGERSLILKWKNPAVADFAGTRIVMKTGGYPTGPFTSTVLATRANVPNSIDSTTIFPLTAGVPYYCSLYAQDSSGNWSPAGQISAVPLGDTSPPADPTDFAANPYTTGNLTLSWKNPSVADFVGTMIRVKTTGYPTTPTDGNLVTNRTATPGSNDSFIHTGLTPGLTYYYRAFAYDYQPAYSAGATTTGIPALMTCAEAKQRADGLQADLRGKVVTAVFTGDGVVY
ncbi:MAG: fibronectin type III domain-containing protein, partial [Armatimonadota bacterium]